MKAVQLYLNSMLPEDLRNYNDVYDAKTLNRILADVAHNYPEKFAEIQHKIANLGRKSSYLQGETISLKDLAPVIDRKPYYEAMKTELKQLNSKAADYTDKRDAILQKYNSQIEKDTALAALAGRNNIAMAVLSGARGKNPQLKAMVSTPGTYSDYKGRTIPVFSKESFAEGVRPALFLASTYGARSSVISAKSSTAKGGDIAKQFTSAASNEVVREHDCGTDNGRVLEIDDESLKGRALAKDAAGIPAGTYIGKEEMRKLRDAGVKSVIVRSPLTCAVHDGLCAKCVGHFYNGGKLPKIGDHIGALASTTTSEPVTQMALCLEENTRVRLTNGSSKAIKDIKPGDKVWAYDKATGRLVETDVINVYDRGKQEVRQCVFTNPYPQNTYSHMEDVLCTVEHKLLTKGRRPKSHKDWKVRRLEDFMDEDSITDALPELPVAFLEKGKQVMKTVALLHSYELEGGPRHCYDIEIAHPDHLFLLANGIISHNSAKHTAGMSSGKKSYSGIPYITQLTQSPEAFKDKAPVADVDGRVQYIEPASQGGYHVTIGGHKHYVPAGHEVLVKVGDHLEAGDQISEGLVDPEDIVKHRGIGEGRLYMADRLNQMLADSGAKTDKRNTEVLARALIRHVHVDNPDGIGIYLPGDTADYESMAASHVAPETAAEYTPSKAIGKYLHRPAMSYSIGTRITPRVAEQLEKYHYDSVLADDEAPGFTPEMERLRTASHVTRDWLASMSTSYIGQQLNESSVRGDDTNIEHNPDYRPRLMAGKDFGKSIEETGEF